MADKKMTQEALASAVGYKSQGAIGNAIGRGSLPKKLNAIAAVLGVRPEWIETGSLPREAGAAPPESPARATNMPTLTPLELDLVAAFRQLPDQEQLDLVRDVMARAESINQVVQRELQRRGISVSGYVTATRAAETLPSPPAGISAPPAEPPPKDVALISDEARRTARNSAWKQVKSPMRTDRPRPAPPLTTKRGKK